jgi:hypothetical protein
MAIRDDAFDADGQVRLDRNGGLLYDLKDVVPAALPRPSFAHPEVELVEGVLIDICRCGNLFDYLYLFGLVLTVAGRHQNCVPEKESQAAWGKLIEMLLQIDEFANHGIESLSHERLEQE